MIAESVSEGLLDPEEHTRLTRALQIRNRMVADVAVPVAEIRAVPVAGAGLRADGRGGRTGPGHNRLLPVPGGRTSTAIHRLPAHQGRADAGRRPATPSIDLALVRPLPRVPESLPLADALSRMRRSNSHLALVTGAGTAAVVAMVALEDLVEGPGRRGAGRDAACLSRLDPEQWTARADEYVERAKTIRGPARQPGRVGEPHPVWDFLFSYYSLRPRQLRCWHPGYGVLLTGGEAIRRYGDRRGYTAADAGVTVSDAYLRSRLDTISFVARPAGGDGAAAGAAELLRAARMGDGLPRRRGAPRAGPAAVGRRGHRRRRRSRGCRAAAVQPLRRVPLLHAQTRRRGTSARPAAPRNRTGSSPVACTPTWTCTNGRTS